MTASGRRVDVWYADLASPAWQSGRALDMLSDDEHARAGEFIQTVHASRFRAAHVALRSILAAYVRRTPASLRFEVNEYGKPRLTADNGDRDGGDRAQFKAQFNLSHAEDLGAVAVTCGRAVGVDVERITPSDDFEELATRFFAPSEAAIIHRATDDRRAALFYRCWTRKEAFVKAHGRGLSLPLDSFDVEPDRAGPIVLTYGDDPTRATWTIHDVDGPPDFSCALAISGEACDVTTHIYWP